MDFAAMNGMDLTPVATILIAVGLAGMWLGRPSTASTSASGASLHGPGSGFGGWLDAATALAASFGLGPRAVRFPVAVSRPARAGAIPAAQQRTATTRRARRRRSAAQTATQPLAARIPVERQWSVLETRVTAAIEAAGQAARLQVKALERLDAADYALAQLAGELEAVLKPRPSASPTAIRPQIAKARLPMPLAA